MAVSDVMAALLDAQIAVAQAGFEMPVMEITSGAYYAALLASDPTVKAPRAGTTKYHLWGASMGDGAELWTTPEQEREFQFAGPTGIVTVRRSVR